MRGRPPKPVEAHKRDGTKPKHHTELVVVGGRNLPDTPPPDMTEVGEQIWGEIASDLHDSNVLAEGDRWAVEQAAAALMRVRQAREIIAEEGLMVLEVKMDKDGNVVSEKHIPHPMLKIEKDFALLFLRFADHLGLSPAARARLGLTKVIGMTAAQMLSDRLGAAPVAQAPPAKSQADIEIEAELESDEPVVE